LREAARREAAREHERTREWLESRGLPKAARVAQREAFNLLRLYGLVSATKSSARVGEDTGRGPAVEAARPLAPDEARELAEACVAMLETQGRPIEATLGEMSAAAGGWLLAEDVARVRELVESMAGKPVESVNVRSPDGETK
ncbi:MAG TPA: hypothetical protein VER08_04540, partial [Pyrinomonadaceae bacterium]|nr:hypothetical protein [Pyrinomonadaceae bacterium]